MSRNRPTADLPPAVTPADLEYPSGDDRLTYDQWKTLPEGFPHALTFYKLDKQWVLTTLLISNPGRRQAAGSTARYYAVGVEDGKVYTVGRGPHVKAVAEVHLGKGNRERLTRYVELWQKGMADALAIRDRISSRRAQGQLYRAAGRTHWNW